MGTVHLTGPTAVDGPTGIDVRATVRADGQEHELWYRTSAEAASDLLDPFLAACLVPAMKRGGTIALHGPASPAFLARLPAIQRVFEVYRADVHHVDRGRFHPVEVTADETRPAVVGTGRATFFSAGVDSFYTALTRRGELDTALFIDDFDTEMPSDVREAVAANTGAATGHLGLQLLRVRTNVRAQVLRGLSADGPASSWLMVGGSVLESVALLHTPGVGHVVHPSSEAIGHHSQIGSGPWLDPLYSAGGQVIEHDDICVNRFEKIRRICTEPVVQQHLRVCWQPAVNCGRCPKCVRTLLALEALGLRDRFGTFPPVPAAELLDRVVACGRENPRATIRFYDEVDDFLDDVGGRADLRAAVAASRVVGHPISRAEALAALAPAGVRRAVRAARSLRRR